MKRWERKLEQARREADEILDRARRELDRVFLGLRADATPGKSEIDMNVKQPSPKERDRGPKDAHHPVLKALGKSAQDVASEVGWDPAMYSRARSGKQAIPEAWALAIQEATRSPAHREGIEPTSEFWPAGVRVIVK